ncbi:hypothetical protein SKAU_G00409660 [Synaphobranchus kaupii]|uniref:SH2 domain-containing protein n=1 Tax=Synaphobranchus kaupii TaxID=118154 RepID=A0A9Q1IBJ2_SYNKA|nr:hypothetical protein SKAU_G00409660 [Synaphobranchus kaupii]
MEQQNSLMVEWQEENVECRLRELTLKWFTNMRAPLILHDGTIPPWFQGYISRKDAEDLMKDKPVGCFLIRLSDKAVGYILSYRGQDRCRHFVIGQTKVGQLVISGDTETHDSLASLIEYYKTCPIEPFGEKLTTSCIQAPSSEVYDVVQVDLKNRPTVSVKAVKDMWSNCAPRHALDHAPNRAPEGTPDCTPDCAPNRAPDCTPDRSPNRAPGHAPDCAPDRAPNRTPDRTLYHAPDHAPNHAPDRAPNRSPDHAPNHAPYHAPDRAQYHDHPPTLPPKTCNRRAAPMTSYEISTPPEVLPRQPRGGSPLRNSLSSSLNGKTTPCAQLEHDKRNAKTPPLLTEQGNLKILPATHPKACNAGLGGGSLPRIQLKAQKVKPTGDVVPEMGLVYSELNLETFRSLSLPIQGMQDLHRHGGASLNPPKLSSNPCKRATCHTYSLLDPREHCHQQASQGLPSSSSLDKLSINPLYQTAWEDCQLGPPRCVPGPVEPHRPPVSQQDQVSYAQVPHEPSSACFLTDNTYELIPDQSFQGSSHTHPSMSNTYELISDQCLRDGPHSNTYETLNDLQPKHSESNWGIKADKWLRFFPENKRK